MVMVMMMMNESKERWIKQYSSGHNILLVGEGDFSFSLSLAMAFGSATNIVATTLDSYDGLIKKYKNARCNVAMLTSLGATLSYGVDATNMENLPDLRWKRFDRIIYNFPHAGFHGCESNPHLINVRNFIIMSKENEIPYFHEHREAMQSDLWARGSWMHRNLVRGFLQNARSLLWFDGQVHINHKITGPFNSWRIEDVASDCSLLYVGRHRFNIKDFPWYHNKRGSGWRCDEAFPLGACRTFVFQACPRAQENEEKKRKRAPSPLGVNELNFSSNGYAGEPCRNVGHTRYDGHHCGEKSLEVPRSISRRRSAMRRRDIRRGRRRRRSLLITRSF